MGQSTSTELSAYGDQAACVTKVLYHTDAGDIPVSHNGLHHKEAEMQKHTMPTKELKCERRASEVKPSTSAQVIQPCKEKEVPRPRRKDVERKVEAEPEVPRTTTPPEVPAAPVVETVQEAVVPASAVKCRKCTITGVDPDKYCLHLTARIARDLELPDFHVTSLAPGKVPALIWHMLSNLGVIRRFKISRHAVLNLVNGIEYVYRELEMPEEWVNALELAHGMYVILRRRKENAMALDEFFHHAKSAPSIGEGIDRVQGLSLILSALVVGLDDVSRHLKHKAERMVSPDIHPRKGLAWRVIHKTGKEILLRLTKVEEQRVEMVVAGAVRVMNDPMEFEEFAHKEAERPRLEQARQANSFLLPVNPSLNRVIEQGCGTVESPRSPVGSRRPRAGDLYDTCTHIEPVGSKLGNASVGSDKSPSSYGRTNHVPGEAVPVKKVIVPSQWSDLTATPHTTAA